MNKKTSKKVLNERKPLVSVVMPVYNAGAFVGQAIESIMSQTYKHIEFIIVDDHSQDNSWEILQKYARKYKKIKIFRNARNLEQARTVTFAMNMAKGDFIARMDADDIALPRRLEAQVNYLLKHPGTVALGGQCLLIDKENTIIGEKRFPTKFIDIYKQSFIFCPAQQPAVMFAINRLPQNFPFYNHGLSPVEDMELLFKLYQYGKVENLQDFVLMYRIHGNNSSLRNFKKSFLLTLVSRLHGVLYYGYKPTGAGVFATALQIFAVFLLPQRTTFFIYKALKRFGGRNSSYSIGDSTLPLEVSKAL